jgi:hypothetical protein
MAGSSRSCRLSWLRLFLLFLLGKTGVSFISGAFRDVAGHELILISFLDRVGLIEANWVSGLAINI